MSAPTPADQLNDAIDRATDQVSQAATQASGSLTDAATTLGQAVGSVDPLTGATISAAGPVLGGIAQGQADVAGGVINAAGDTATGYANATGAVATGYAHAGGHLVNAAGQVLNDQATAYSNAGSDLLDGFEHGDPAGGLVHAGGDIILGDAKEVGHILTGVAGAAGDIGTGVFHGVEDVAGGLAKATGDVVNGVVKDFEDVGHGVLEGAAHGLKSLFGGGESKDEILKKFGHENPDALAASRSAAKKGGAELAKLASALNSGDSAAVGTADELLKPGETGLAFFGYFLPAYNAWTGQHLEQAQLRTAYEQEFGLSFSAYASDAELMAQVSTALTGDEQTLQNAYNALIPTWQGPAAANFEAKLSVFFSGASATGTTVSDVGVEIKTLVEGLQKLILAKAEVVNGLYADTLDPGIDGAMAQTIVKVAQGQLHDDMRRVVLGIFHLAAHGRHGWDDDGYYSDDCLDDPSRQAAINAAAAWCNGTLMPQTEARLKALSEVCSQTQQRIQQAFAKLVEDLKAIKDPFAGMTTATAATGTGTGSGGGGGGAGGGGGPQIPGGGSAGGGGPTAPAGSTAPAGGSFTPPPAPTYPTPGTPGQTTPQGTGTSPVPGVPTIAGVPTDPSTGVTRPAGLPTGAGWIPPGVPLPSGWTEDPTTGEVLPHGWSVDPTTGLPVQSSGAGSSTGSSGGVGGVGGVDPKHDIHKNKDGSVSLGQDRGLTISPEKGKKGIFTLSDTDADGTMHTYHVHFDKHGDPVVTEVVPNDAGGDGIGAITSPAADLSGGGGGGGGDGVVGGGGAGFGGGVASGTPAAAHAGTHASADLQPGEQVSADNTMAASGAPAAQSSPVAGSAAPDQSGGGHQGGAIGGMPMGAGMGRGAGGGQEQESSRKYAQRGDVVGEDDLEEWQRMGPVIGEQ